MPVTKSAVIASFSALLVDRLRELSEGIAELNIAMEGESKSSAGDKHETARARLQTEQENLQRQRQESETLLNELQAPAFSTEKTLVVNGALVRTTMGLFLIGPALGKILLDDTVVFAISLRSPLGTVLQGKKRGMAFELNAQSNEILEIE